MNNILRFLPGKTNIQHSGTWLPLWVHLMDTEGVMRELVKSWLCTGVAGRIDPDEEKMERLCVFTALVHDIGKIAAGFAAELCRYLPDIKERLENMGVHISDSETKLPHAYLGESILLDLGCPEGIASVVGSHHGKPRDNDDVLIRLEYSDNKDRIWQELRNEYFRFALREAGYSDVGELPDDLDKPTLMLLSGLLIMADWIASNHEYFPMIDVDEMVDISLYPDRVDAGWRKVGLTDPWNEGHDNIDSGSFREEFGFPPNVVQQAVIDVVGDSAALGILILEAQMGIGKTEAALAAAEMMSRKSGRGGIYFGLPTQATSNGIFGRLLDWAKKQSEETTHAVRLAHSRADLNEDYDSLLRGTANIDDDNGGVIVHQWFTGRKQAMLANFVIGTVDQLLMAALKQKHVMLRHLGLAGKVVVVDECHAYDAYMSKYLDRALMWMGAYGVPVIILSATLPAERRSELVEAYLYTKELEESTPNWRKNMGYPLITWTDGNMVHQRLVEVKENPKHIEIFRIKDEALTEIVMRETENGGYAGVIVNTVSRAQEYACRIREAIPDSEVILFHSQFVATDRAEIEKTLIARLGKGNRVRGGKLIVVGTQVLEQSLDIDFDVMITDLCPMDLLLQRMGRLHRREQTIRPASLSSAKCYVMGAMGELEKGSRSIYGEWLLMQTSQLLPDKIIVPNDIPELVQATYGEPIPCAISSSEQSAWDDYETKIRDKENRAENYTLDYPEDAFGDETLTGLLINSDKDSEATGVARVRDSISRIEVLIMVRYNNDRIGFLPWYHKGKTVPRDRIPDEEECRDIARQRINLPFALSVGKRGDATIKELEELKRIEFPEWENSGWLRGELILLLDEELHGELNGFDLCYNRPEGLKVTGKKGKDGSNREKIQSDR